MAAALARVLDGRARRDEVLASLAAELDAAGRPPVGFATVLVGDDEASARYVGLKHEAARRVGIEVRGVALPASTDQVGLESELDGLAVDPAVHGVLLQLPLPEGSGLDALAAAERIPPDKDVDGMTSTSLGRLLLGAPGHRPATAAGVLDLLARHGVGVAGRRAAVVGTGTMVARPLALMLLAAGASSVSLLDPADPDAARACRSADLVVSDAARAHLVGPGWVAAGATVVDVGVSFVDGRLVGDVDPAVAEVAGTLVPNPGGAGPMTVAMLLSNTLAAARAAGGLGSLAAASPAGGSPAAASPAAASPAGGSPALGSLRRAGVGG